MFTRQKQVGLTKLIITATVTLAMTVLTGCQSSRYSQAENEVYRHFDKWSRKVPDDLAAAPAQDSSPGRSVYEYVDRKASTGVVKKEKMVRSEISADTRELRVADATPADDGKVRFMGIFGYNGEYSFAGPIEGQKGNPFVTDVVYTLQKDAESVTYFRERGTLVWRRCRLPGDIWSAFDANKRAYCLQRAEEVPAEHVQRYIDLADRFYKTYFFIE
jgi:hypothetical protein